MRSKSLAYQNQGWNQFMGSETRRREQKIFVRVSEYELAEISERASAYDLSNPAYLRSVGLGREPKSTLDSQHILELAKINGDIGRLGGLLKLWLLEKEGHAKSLNIPELMIELKELKSNLESKVSKL